MIYIYIPRKPEMFWQLFATSCHSVIFKTLYENIYIMLMQHYLKHWYNLNISTTYLQHCLEMLIINPIITFVIILLPQCCIRNVVWKRWGNVDTTIEKNIYKISMCLLRFYIVVSKCGFYITGIPNYNKCYEFVADATYFSYIFTTCLKHCLEMLL